MRTFIAIALPQQIKDYLAQLEDRLKATQADVKWVTPENIHLTLKFLGERDDKKVEKIKQILEEAAGKRQPFQMRLSSVGAFPKISSPRVVWVGLDKGDRETIELAMDLEERIAKVGIPKEERPFSSHITIGRIRSPKNREKLVQELKNLENKTIEENLEFQAAQITLFKSTLTPQGPIYEILKVASLKTT